MNFYEFNLVSKKLVSKICLLFKFNLKTIKLICCTNWDPIAATKVIFEEITGQVKLDFEKMIVSIVEKCFQSSFGVKTVHHFVSLNFSAVPNSTVCFLHLGHLQLCCNQTIRIDPENSSHAQKFLHTLHVLHIISLIIVPKIS